MHDPDLDAPLAAALSRLSAVCAPETLLPRVLAATQAMASRPWYARTWDTWPVRYQTASVAICLLVLAAMTQTLPSADGWWIDDASERAVLVRDPTPTWESIAFYPHRVKELLEKAGHNPDAIMRIWRDRDWLETSSDHKRNVKAARIQGEKTWAVVIKRTAIEEPSEDGS